jgi:hypothetical protein
MQHTTWTFGFFYNSLLTSHLWVLGNFFRAPFHSFTQSATYGVLNPGKLLLTKTSRMLITHGNDVDGAGTASVVCGGQCKSYYIKA